MIDTLSKGNINLPLLSNDSLPDISGVENPPPQLCQHMNTVDSGTGESWADGIRELMGQLTCMPGLAQSLL